MYNLRLNGNQTLAHQTKGKILLSMKCIAKASKPSYLGQKEQNGDIQHTSIPEAT